MRMLPYKQVSKADWLIPVGSLAINFISIVAGLRGWDFCDAKTPNSTANHKAKSALKKGHLTNGQ